MTITADSASKICKLDFAEKWVASTVEYMEYAINPMENCSKVQVQINSMLAVTVQCVLGVDKFSTNATLSIDDSN